MRSIALFLLLVKFTNVHGFGLFEPTIECTVIKVVSTTTVFGIVEFPKLYQSINNDPLKSVLHIAGKKLPKVKPKTVFKTDNFEKISIITENDNFELQLHGKPVSRNGTLTANGKILAEVTCH